MSKAGINVAEINKCKEDSFDRSLYSEPKL